MSKINNAIYFHYIYNRLHFSFHAPCICHMELAAMRLEPKCFS